MVDYLRSISLEHYTEEHSLIGQTSKMELLTKIVESVRLIFFKKSFILDVWLGSKSTSEYKNLKVLSRNDKTW